MCTSQSQFYTLEITLESINKRKILFAIVKNDI